MIASQALERAQGGRGRELPVTERACTSLALRGVTVAVQMCNSRWPRSMIVPIANSATLSAKLLKRASRKVYDKFSHGMATTNADVTNADLLAFIKGQQP